MLRKIIAPLLAVCMLLCLFACDDMGDIPSDTTLATQTTTPEGTDESTSTEPIDTTETTEADTTEPQTSVEQTDPVDTTTQPTHTHNYSNATCTTPKKCSCGATSGNALGHKYSSATCTAPAKCSRCGVTNGSALGHKYSSATCTAPAKCSRCGITTGSELGHNYEGGICSVCETIDEALYVESRVNAAEQAFSDYTKYEDALKIIKEAIQKCPNSEVLKAKRDYYQSFAPVNLCDLDPYKDSYSYISDGSKTDGLGNYYEDCVYKSFYSASASATYDVGYKYNSFTATVFMRSDCTGESYGTIEIYGDGELLYQKTGIDVYGRPFDITVDVTGVQDLMIVIESDSGAYIFGLGNCILQRTVK